MATGNQRFPSGAHRDLYSGFARNRFWGSVFVPNQRMEAYCARNLTLSVRCHTLVLALSSLAELTSSSVNQVLKQIQFQFCKSCADSLFDVFG